MSEKNNSEEKKMKDAKALTADYEKNKENLEKLNSQLSNDFEEEMKKDLFKKKKKKSAKELLKEEEEQKRKEEEERKKKEEEEATDPTTVRGLMNLIKLQQIQRRKEFMMRRIERQIERDIADTLKETGKAMADYLFLTGYAKKKDGTLSDKKLDSEAPEGILEPKTKEQEEIVNWLENGQTEEEMQEHMDDMEQMSPGAFFEKMAKGFADHKKKEMQAKNPDAIPVAPAGFHAPGVSPVAAFLATQPQPEIENPVLRPDMDPDNGSVV